MRVRTGRNLNKYPLPGSMSKSDRINLERDMGAVFKTLIANPDFGGRYYSVKIIIKITYKILKFTYYIMRYIKYYNFIIFNNS